MIEYRKPWRRQPQRLAKVSRGSPLTNGLVALVSGAAMFDAVGGGLPAASILTGTTVASAGASSIFTGTQYAQFSIRAPRFAGPKTLLVVGVVDEGSSNRILIGVGDSGSSANVAEIYRMPTGQLSYIEVGNGSSSGNTASPSTELVVGNIFLAIARTESDSRRVLFVRGSPSAELQSAVNTTTATPTTAVDSLLLGAERYNGGIGAHLNGKIFLGACWNRSISDAEVEQLAENPWQLLDPLHLFFPQSSFPTLSAATYAPGSLTASGFRPRVTAATAP